MDCGVQLLPPAEGGGTMLQAFFIHLSSGIPVCQQGLESSYLKQSVPGFKSCFVIRNFSVRWFALVWTTLPKVIYRRLTKNIGILLISWNSEYSFLSRQWKAWLCKKNIKNIHHSQGLRHTERQSEVFHTLIILTPSLPLRVKSKKFYTSWSCSSETVQFINQSSEIY